MNLLFKTDPILDALNVQWAEEDHHRRFWDLTAKRGEHGGLSLIPAFVRHRESKKHNQLEGHTTLHNGS